MQSLIATTGRISPDWRNALATVSAREFFDGDLEVDSRPSGTFGVRKSVTYPISLTHLSATDCELGYRRGWSHIRGNQVGFRVIWLLRKGSLRVTRSQGNHEVNAGQATFIDSGVPFHARTRCDASGEYESIQLIVPGHLFLRHLQEADRMTHPLDLVGPHAQTLEAILDILVRDGEQLTQRLACSLADGLLAALADLLDEQEVKVSRQQRLAAERLGDVTRYILDHLSDPQLSFEQVANHHGISPRYLCYIFKANETSFSEFLWQSRLRKARELLMSAPASSHPIQSIAYAAGFKSAAHFSRLFKAAFEVTPSDFRGRHKQPD